MASQLVCLANLENLNALFINEGMAQPERLQKLNRIAIEQMEILTSEHSRKLLGGMRDEGFKDLRNDPIPLPGGSISRAG